MLEPTLVANLGIRSSGSLLEMGCKVAIHQPHYFPSFVQLKKIISANVFLFFDDVQIPLGKSKVYRTKVKRESEALWLSVPLRNKSEKPAIVETEVSNFNFTVEHQRKLDSYYSSSNLLTLTDEIFERLIAAGSKSIADVDISITEKVCEKLGFSEIQFFRTSQMLSSPNLFPDTGERLIALVKEAGGDIYLSGDGPGSRRYLNPEKFSAAEVELEILQFEHPTYRQSGGGFIPDLSVLDLVANCTLEEARTLLEQS